MRRCRLAESESLIAYFLPKIIMTGNVFFWRDTLLRVGRRPRVRRSRFVLVLLIWPVILSSGVLVEIQIQCPHCGEIITTNADTSQGDYATIEDCAVCCAPMNIEVTCEPGRIEDVRVSLA
jgi:hypothetical protein